MCSIMSSRDASCCGDFYSMRGKLGARPHHAIAQT